MKDPYPYTNHTMSVASSSPLYVVNVFGYKYGSNTFRIKRDINSSSFDLSKKYAIVSLCYEDRKRVKVIAPIYNIMIEDVFIHYQIFQEERESESKSENDDSLLMSQQISVPVRGTKKVEIIYIEDCAELCHFIKRDFNLEDHYEFPQFIIEYSHIMMPHISHLIKEKEEYKEVLRMIGKEKEEVDKVIHKNFKKLNLLTHDENTLQKELQSIYKKILY